MKDRLLCFITIIALFSCNKEMPLNSDLNRSNINGNVKKITTNTFDAKEKFGEPVKKGKTSTHTIFFNKKGFYTKQAYPIGETLYLYRDNKIYKTESSDEYAEIIVNDNGFVVEYTSFNKKDSLIRSKWKYTYEDNLLTRQILYDKNGNLIYKSILSYDKNNVLVKKEEFHDNFKQEEINYLSYDDYGNVTKEKGTYFSPRFKDTHTTKIIEYKYKYDNHNNWISKTTYRNGKIEDVEEREITYY